LSYLVSLSKSQLKLAAIFTFKFFFFFFQRCCIMFDSFCSSHRHIRTLQLQYNFSRSVCDIHTTAYDSSAKLRSYEVCASWSGTTINVNIMCNIIDTGSTFIQHQPDTHSTMDAIITSSSSYQSNQLSDDYLHYYITS
jgi:hypothetical protein